MDWTLKIQALLALPPDSAIAPEGVEERARHYLQVLGVDPEIPDCIRQAHEIAFGLDVPPFIQERARSSVFRDQPLLKHPLSGQSESLDTTMPQQDQIEKALEAAFRQLSTLASDPKKLFIALWRFLAEVSQKNAPEELKLHWGLLPADPRIPDHSIWDHASLASAIAGTWDSQDSGYKPALLLFNIGSAQEFLMTARRTQDLWMGSYLFSYLTWEAIKVIADDCGPDCLIFPDLRGQPLVDLWLYQSFFHENDDLWKALGGPSFLNSLGEGLGEDLKIASFPNMFTAIVPEDKANKLAQEAVSAVGSAWRKIAANVRKVVEKAIEQPLAGDDEWERQIHDLVDRLGVFWAAYALDRAPEAPDARSKLQQAIAEFDMLIKLEAKGRQPFEDFIKLYDASQNEANIGMGYSLVSQLAARVLTNRKSLRDFRQHEAPGWKCSLCGTRRALGPQKGRKLREFWEGLMDVEKEIDLDGKKWKVKLAGRIRKGDRLCAVCLTKRLAWEQHFLPRVFMDFLKRIPEDKQEEHLLFPSTSSIATASFKRRILERLQQDDDEARRLCQLVKDYNGKVKAFLRPSDGRKPYDIYYYSAPIPALEKLVPKELSDFTRIDGEWLFGESFVPEKIEREYPVKKADLQGLEEAKQAATKLRAEAERLGIELTKYYALIAMDGDHMGQWLSGQIAPQLRDLLHYKVHKELESDPSVNDLLSCKRPLGPALHISLTAAQKNFALQVVRQIVEEEHVGKLIYAGGDDVLAFVPISELLPVLRKLRWLCSGDYIDDLSKSAKLENVANGFATRVNSPDDKRRFMLLGSEFSSSAGVAIVHHTHPFSHAVEEAYRAMKEHAKDEKKLGRDAFAIHLMKRSGEPLEAGMKWRLEVGDSSLNTLREVEWITQAIAQGRLSSKLAYDLHDESLGVAKLKLREAQELELRRLVIRHVREKEHLKEITDKIATLWAGLWEQCQEGAWELIIDLLLLARFLAQEGSDGGR